MTRTNEEARHSSFKSEITKQTVIYKAVGDLHLEADVYTHVTGGIEPHTPVVLFFHGGGLVGYNRLLLPANIVQSSLSRGWPLVSADYRLLPQVTGKEIVEDAKDVYQWTRSSLWKLLNRIQIPHAPTMENVIVMGASGGGVLALTAAHHLQPKPLALLIYYGAPTFQTDFASTSLIHTYGGGPVEPMQEPQIAHFLAEPVNAGHTPLHDAFDTEMLLENFSENKEWTNQYPVLMEGVDRGLEHEGWKSYPKTVLVHGDQDVDAPYQGALDAVGIIVPHRAQLFAAEGESHAWDTGLFLGDPGLAKVEEAWKAIDDIVEVDAKRARTLAEYWTNAIMA